MERKRNNIISCILMILTLVLLITNTVNMTMALSPADLSPKPTATYSIEFSIMFGTDENGERFHHQNSYMANQFHCYLTDTNEYLVAEYDETAKCYVLTGYTKNKDEATVFIGGKDIDNTKMVIISGLPADNYTIDHLKATEGYTTIRELINITITSDDVTVYGEKISITNDNRIIFRIALTPGYDLSDYYTSNTSSTYLIITCVSAFVLICCAFIIIIMYMNYRRRKAAHANIKSEHNIMAEETVTPNAHITDFDGNDVEMEPIDAITEPVETMTEFNTTAITPNIDTPVEIEIENDSVNADASQMKNIETNNSEPDEPIPTVEPESNDSNTDETE